MARSSPRGSSIDEDLPFQRKQWRVERIGWLLMTVLIVCALAGVLGGGGLLSSAASTSPDGGVSLKHERFARRLASTALEITAAPASGRTLQVQIAESYLDAMAVQSITPEPDSMTSANGAAVLTFARTAGGAAKIRLRLEPQTAGIIEGWAAVDQGARMRIKQYILP